MHPELTMWALEANVKKAPSYQPFSGLNRAYFLFTLVTNYLNSSIHYLLRRGRLPGEGLLPLLEFLLASSLDS